MSPHEYEQLRRGMRRSFDIAELTDQEFAELEAAARTRATIISTNYSNQTPSDGVPCHCLSPNRAL